MRNVKSCLVYVVASVLLIGLLYTIILNDVKKLEYASIPPSKYLKPTKYPHPNGSSDYDFEFIREVSTISADHRLNAHTITTKQKLPTSNSSSTPFVRLTALQGSTTNRRSLYLSSTPTPLRQVVYQEPTVYERYSFTVAEPNICTSKTHTLVLIQTAPNHHEQRMAIRNTWGSFGRTQTFAGEILDEEVKIAFTFGLSHSDLDNQNVMNESLTFHDVIIADFIDSYRNLTLKTLTSLRWVDNYCPSATYFIKCDDDTMVHIPNLLRFFRVNRCKRGMVGAIGMHLNVIRKGRWRVDPALYNNKVFPPYYSGPAYVINTDLIKDLLLAAQSTPIIPIEDAYVTGILAKKIGVRRFSPGGFAFTSSRPPTRCHAKDTHFYSGSNLPPDYMSYIYNALSQDIDCLGMM